MENAVELPHVEVGGVDHREQRQNLTHKKDRRQKDGQDHDRQSA